MILGVFGLLLELLLYGLAMLALGLVAWQFAGFHAKRHCPACQRDGLETYDALPMTPGRLTTYRCVHCGAGYRVQLDGSLDLMPKG